MKTFRQKFIDTWTKSHEPADSTYAGWTALDFARESIADREAEFLSETAMFGDAGPGTGLSLSQAKARLARIERLLKRARSREMADQDSAVVHKDILDIEDKMFEVIEKQRKK